MSLTIQELIDQPSGPVYLINTAGDIVSGGGDVHISVPRKDGSVTSITVPKTWLPTEATALVPRKFLLESSNFMSSLSKGLVQAVTVEEATRLSNRPGADSERQRLKTVAEAVKIAAQAKGIGRNVTISTDGDDVQEGGANGTLNKPVLTNKATARNTAQPMPAAVHSNNGVVNLSDLDGELDEASDVLKDEEAPASFRAWVTKINALPITEAVAELQRRGRISSLEAKYLVDHTQHPKIRSFVQKQLTA